MKVTVIGPCVITGASGGRVRGPKTRTEDVDERRFVGLGRRGDGTNPLFH